ncbi:MAG: HlyC/CorC family transporter [Planctomycetes bacterium]|nr:HlyC/CorC family transporter [Planctomycetota bacterium]MCP4838418.1 HlyC/CorC family transporter [Planctomycetota bacterium]
MITFASLLVLAVAIWLAAIDRALRNGPRTALCEHLERAGRATLRDALLPRFDAAADLLSLARIALILVFLAIWLGAIVGWDQSAVSDWPGRMLGGSIAAAVLIWIADAILAPAIARWAGDALLRGSLPLIRFAAAVSPILAWISRFFNEVIRRLAGEHAHGNGRTGEAEAELLRSIEAKQREGELAEGAATLLENVVDFTSTDVGEVMTPRTEIEGIELTDDLAAIKAFILEAGHSRIPVYKEDLDHIAGILYVKDLIPFLGQDASSFTLAPLLRRPIVVPETKPVADLLADFQKAEVHMAIVVDEYGGTAGLATIEDVLEEIVGEIYDEHEGDDEDDEPELVEVEANTWEVDGRFHIDDFNETLGSVLPEDDEYDTIGGWFTARVGRVPEAGETLEEYDLAFTVLAAEPTHVTRLRVSKGAS